MDNVTGGGAQNSIINNDLDSLSNLLINSYEDDAAALDQYESEIEQNLQENLIMEKEQSNQRLFQSFQTSACAVAQMFKDKGSVMSSWESFQNSAGAITVLYKDSLEACKVHMDLGIHLGQQRKLKDIINWIKKKKKRSIRKDELISFLIGKQYPSQNQMFNLFNHQTASNNPFNLNHTTNSSTNRHRNQQLRQQRNTTLVSNTQTSNTLLPNNNSTISNTNTTTTTNTNNTNNTNSNSNNNNVNNVNAATGTASVVPPINPTINQLNLINSGDNSNGSEVETNSDLATFREALIMHNRSRDTPVNHTHTTVCVHHNQTNHNTNPSIHHTHNTNQSNLSSNMLNTTSQQQAALNCDDLDCFFCEQIATHIEHKRSSSNLNFETDSPTRKRSRFY